MKKRTCPPAPPTTGELINRLSCERLTLYRQGSGRPFPRDVRARLVEIAHELDRLWDLRRQELASPPLPLRAPLDVTAEAPRKVRAGNTREVA
jgi:hypothetical protein